MYMWDEVEEEKAMGRVYEVTPEYNAKFLRKVFNERMEEKALPHLRAFEQAMEAQAAPFLVDYAPSQRSKNYLWHRERRIEWDCFLVWIFIAAVAGVEVFGLWCLAGAFAEVVARWMR